ncbi:hypothetical protein R3P38DRAFT_2792137 [Favolaschia claudopus]|uniref:Glutathione transferase n=1 Tax=Favolaschia claudopus TaxID=2862362 RepID=A0AAW0AG32_9AGAR
MTSALLSSPLSLYSIPVVWLTAYVPVALKGRAVMQDSGRRDWQSKDVQQVGGLRFVLGSVQPRSNVGRVAGDDKIPRDVAARIERMEGAHLNGLENFPIWAIAVLAGNFAGLDNYTMNIASITYILGRSLYNYIYINQKTRVQSSMRTLVWASSLMFPMYLLVAAANKVSKQ